MRKEKLIHELRLSLPSDNDRLMERFVALQPPEGSSEQHWMVFEDAFHVDLWSIEPYIQVSGVGENDTLIIDKALGARIELDMFTDVCAVKLSRYRRLQGVMAGMAVIPQWSARLARAFRRAKFDQVYPRLFSFEGFMKIEDIEEKLFGAPAGLLSWSKYASTLSQHEPGNPFFELKTGMSGNQGDRFAGLNRKMPVDLTGEVDCENQKVVFSEGVERDSIDCEDGRIMTYPVTSRQPWCECSCTAAGACACTEMTDRKLDELGSSPMGEEKVTKYPKLCASWPFDRRANLMLGNADDVT